MEWFRWDQGTVTDPKFQWVARRSWQNMSDVLAVWASLLERVSQEEEGGCIGGEVACRSMSDDDFLKAVQVYIRQERYFPCPADILRIQGENGPRGLPLFTPLQEEYILEEIHRNTMNSAMLRRSVRSGGEDVKLFFLMDSWKPKDKLARTLLGETYPAWPLLLCVRWKGDGRARYWCNVEKGGQYGYSQAKA